jgi:hypothetical protein
MLGLNTGLFAGLQWKSNALTESARSHPHSDGSVNFDIYDFLLFSKQISFLLFAKSQLAFSAVSIKKKPVYGATSYTI